VKPLVSAIPLDLNGYTDLPPGKIASIVTYLEMHARPDLPRIARPDLAVRRVAAPDLDWYRDLYRRIGERWLWFSRAVMPEARLRERLRDPATEVHAVERDGMSLGFAELSFALPGEVEVAMFGVVPEATGTGVARFLMEEVLDRIWRGPLRRAWLHTCSLDHPAALRFYQARGFRPYKLAVEVADDPRLAGYLPESAGVNVPVIRPAGGGA
jgi:GNAT superfamily N-acetyltransferase